MLPTAPVDGCMSSAKTMPPLSASSSPIGSRTPSPAEKALREKGDIESVLDVDSVLKYIAANTLLESYDSYSGQFSQNY